MPLDLHIIRSNDFVRLGARGNLDFEASSEALRELAQACRKRGIDRALLDLRELPMPDQPLFTPAELAALIGTFREVGFTRSQRLAVLYRTDPHHGVRMFAFIGKLRGWKVRAFTEFESALLWLSADPVPTHHDASESIPIKTSKGRIQITDN